MAELIDRVRLRTEVDRLFSRRFINENTMVTMKNMIDNQPTTTEAEIRNKAIDEFAEKLKGYIAKQVEDAECSNDLCTEIFQSEIDEIAEQLKEA